MDFLDAGALFAAAFAGGALNSVAGGGSFFTFPTLVFLGVPPIAANATSTVALWPGSVAGARAFWTELQQLRRHIVPLSAVSLTGGFAGAYLLLHTAQKTFEALIPWLLLVATVVFALGPSVLPRLRSWRGNPQSQRSAVQLVLVQLGVAVYGGYFGGGMGIIMLAAYAAVGMTSIHAMNGLKNWLAVIINGVAVVTFVAAGAVFWPQALVMMGGSVAGGFGGAAAARRVDPKNVRRLVVAVGTGLTVYFFLRGR